MDFFGILFDMKNGKKIPYSKNYFDTLFAAKLAEMQVKTITGTLPLTFTTSETALRSWTIYGNNTPHNYSAEGTLPLTFTSHTAGEASDWSISGNDEPGTANLFDATNCGLVEVATNVYRFGTSLGKLPAGTYTLSYTADIGAAAYSLYLTTREGTTFAGTIAIYPTSPYSFVVTDDIDEVIIRTAYSADDKTWEQLGFTNIMLVKGSTAPDHYIPYQQGVGQRTENLMPAPANGTYTNNRATMTVTDGVYHIVVTAGSNSSNVFIDIPEFKIPESGYVNLLNTAIVGGGSIVFMYNRTALHDGYLFFPANRNVAINSELAGKVANQIWVYMSAGVSAVDFIVSPMVTNTAAPDHYIPYGYQIPITVSQQGQTDKTVDIYIGDSPLTEGETVSKTSTGVDIELFDGSNTITTSLYNKPEMSIEGVDYVGVGEPINDSWQIPLTVSDGTNTATVNVPIEAPLTEGQSVTDTLTINTFEGENTISTTLTNKPNMSITYKGG